MATTMDYKHIMKAAAILAVSIQSAQCSQTTPPPPQAQPLEGAVGGDPTPPGAQTAANQGTPMPGTGGNTASNTPPPEANPSAPSQTEPNNSETRAQTRAIQALTEAQEIVASASLQFAETAARNAVEQLEHQIRQAAGNLRVFRPDDKEPVIVDLRELDEYRPSEPPTLGQMSTKTALQVTQAAERLDRRTTRAEG